MQQIQGVIIAIGANWMMSPQRHHPGPKVPKTVTIKTDIGYIPVRFTSEVTYKFIFETFQPGDIVDCYGSLIGEQENGGRCAIAFRCHKIVKAH